MAALTAIQPGACGPVTTLERSGFGPQSANWVALLYGNIMKFQVKKNQHKTITTTIYKTEYSCFAGNKTNSAAKLGT